MNLNVEWSSAGKLWLKGILYTVEIAVSLYKLTFTVQVYDLIQMHFAATL